MTFAFDVGINERHRVEFNFNPMWRNLSVKVDGCRIVSDFVVLSFSLVRKYQVVVGRAEQHLIVIEKERKLFFAGFRPHKYRIFVDNQLVDQREGY